MMKIIVRYFKNGKYVDEEVTEKKCYATFKRRKKQYGNAEIICQINGIEHSPL